MQGGDYRLIPDLFTASMTAQHVQASISRAVIDRPYSGEFRVRMQFFVQSPSPDSLLSFASKTEKGKLRNVHKDEGLLRNSWGAA
jgi:hypothetical protein